MTKRERAQVVELLRCAADDADDGAFTRALAALMPADNVAIGLNVYMSASEAFYLSPFISFSKAGYRHRLLEAAARVEEGSCP